jgi:hypothetical protein
MAPSSRHAGSGMTDAAAKGAQDDRQCQSVAAPTGPAGRDLSATASWARQRASARSDDNRRASGCDSVGP